MADLIPWEALGAVVTLLGAGGGATAWILAEINHSRRDSSDGRQRLYRRLDEMTADISRTYVRQDVHDANLKVVQQSLEETHRMLAAMAGRVCPYDTGERSFERDGS